MIPVKGYNGKRVGVLGLGRTGLATAAALQAGGATPVCWDDTPAARALAEVEGYDVEDLSRPREAAALDFLITSPGIPHLYPEAHKAIQAAWDHGVPVDNDIGLFFQSFADDEWGSFDRDPKVVCITGSNGKSTTSALLHHILQHANRPSQLGGNIGKAVLSLDEASDGEVAVIELSSYQTDLARTLQPDVAIFLNLSPDHLDRHAGQGGYFAAKKRLFTQGLPERSIIGVDEPEGRYLSNIIRDGNNVIEISTTRQLKGNGWSVFVRKGFLVEWRKGRQMAGLDLRKMEGLPGVHNQQNACAAYAACRHLGLAPKVIEAAMASYTGLRHRCQQVGEVAGVKFINNSKATNAASAGKSLLAFENILWIAGGQAKEGGIEGLDFGAIKKAYLIGEAAKDFAAQLGDIPHVISGTLEAAVEAAKADAEDGDTILLAPACASFDQFESFEERGEVFEALVE